MALYEVSAVCVGRKGACLMSDHSSRITNPDKMVAPARRILMTRAQDSCARWADALYPLADRMVYFTPFTTKPVPLPITVREELLAATHDDATAWVITSARALEALQATDGELVALLRQRLFFTVGEDSAQALRKAGFPRVTAASGDLAALASLIALNAPQQNIQRLIHLAGSVTVADLADVLKQSPFEVTTHVVYEAALNVLPAELSADLNSGAITDIVLLSARVAQHLGAATIPQASDTLTATAGPARLYCLSPRIAAVARTAFAALSPEIIIAPRPEIPALLTMIDAPAPGLQNADSESALTK